MHKNRWMETRLMGMHSTQQFRELRDILKASLNSIRAAPNQTSLQVQWNQCRTRGLGVEH